MLKRLYISNSLDAYYAVLDSQYRPVISLLVMVDRLGVEKAALQCKESIALCEAKIEKLATVGETANWPAHIDAMIGAEGQHHLSLYDQLGVLQQVLKEDADAIPF